MNQTLKVSVHILTYNHINFIRATLDSVLKQDYDNLEIVIADDASTDGTQAILQQYAAQYPDKIILRLNEKNLGITHNANVALAGCSGDLIAFLGGDDLLLPGKIAAQVAIFERDSEVVLSYHPVEIFDSLSGKTLYITNLDPKQDLNNAYDIIRLGGIPGACSVMVRRSACPVGGFNVKLTTVSDWMFFIEVALTGKVEKLNGIYSRYRKHDQGITRQIHNFLQETLFSLDLLIEGHPDCPELIEHCNKGKARYLAGEAFRQFAEDVDYAHELLNKANNLDPKNCRIRILFLFSKFKPLTRVFGKTINKFKYHVKRYFL